MMKKIALCLALFLGGCSAPPIVLEKVSFVDQERTFPMGLIQDETRVVGVLLAEISSNKDLYEHGGNWYVTKSFKAKTCSTGLNIRALTRPIPVAVASSERFHYHLVINYKGTTLGYNGTNKHDFNLASSPEDICVNLYYGDMLYKATSNIVRYEISGSLLQTMKDYEEKSGEVYFK